MQYFKNEAKGGFVWLWVVIFSIICIVHSIVVTRLTVVLTGSDVPFKYSGTTLQWGWYLFLSLKSAAGEELLFRSPLALITKDRISTITISGIIILSILFALSHSIDVFAFYNQGIIGIYLCLAYLKCGGLHQHRLKAIWITTFIHVLINFTLTAIAWLHGELKFV